jgi:hypothetical protein
MEFHLKIIEAIPLESNQVTKNGKGVHKSGQQS